MREPFFILVISFENADVTHFDGSIKVECRDPCFFSDQTTTKTWSCSQKEHRCYCPINNGEISYQIYLNFALVQDIFLFFICMFYQVLGVPHSSSSTPTWGSVLPSIVETRGQNSRGFPLLFSNRNLGSFCA